MLVFRKCEFSLQNTYTKNELVRRCFWRILATNNETIIVQDTCLQTFYALNFKF